MSINQLLDEYGRLCDSPENKRRLSLWQNSERSLRGETQWHGIPNYTVVSGRPMPVTAECLEKMWEQVLGMDLTKYYTDPDYFLEFFLKFKMLKFLRLSDDTPLTRELPVCFGVTHEAGILGQKVYFRQGEEPTFGSEAVLDETTVLPKTFDFANNPYVKDRAIPYYERVKTLAGKEFNVIFPEWYRGPQGVALYLRGYQNFAIDLFHNPDFAHRVLRYVTDAAKQFAMWRSNYTGEPIGRCDLFNDDIPMMSPTMYRDFIFPYEQELADFHDGVFYWHSCGDITKHVPEVDKLSNIGILDFGVTMEDKQVAMKGLKTSQALELRVMAKRHIQDANEAEAENYIRSILQSCREHGTEKYVIRSSGMSILLGGDEDLKKLARWVELVREVQSE